MTIFCYRSLLSAILLGCGAPAGVALAAGTSPLGVWIDHSGEGAVEITDCGGKLCGRVVWLKKAENASTCNTQVIGDAKATGGGKWDQGWIYDPDSQNKYDVEITPLKGDRLKVYGYAGSKLFGETMTWTRAPADLKRCDRVEEAKIAPPPPQAQTHASTLPAPVAVEPVTPAAPVREAGVMPPKAEPGSPVSGEAKSTGPFAAANPPVVDAPAGEADRAGVKPVDSGAAAKARKPVQTAGKKGEVFEVEGVKVRLAKGKCGVTIKELGSFDFPCD